MATTQGTNEPKLLPNMKRHQYGDHILQTYDVLMPERTSSQEQDSQQKYWIVYIHGGYFRDPAVDSTSFQPTISLLESSSSSSSTVKSQIAGYTSINYRLSPHPSQPAHLTTARWPDQPTDILHAISHLQSHYPSSKRYILAGHSVGASLAFHFVASTLHSQTNNGITPPAALLGLSGIYDFPAIHISHPEYESLTKNGMDSKFYGDASPALYPSSAYTDTLTTTNKSQTEAKSKKAVVVLAHSHDDGLVPWQQVERMTSIFDKDQGVECRVIEIRGEHNKIWEDGREVVRALEGVFGEML